MHDSYFALVRVRNPLSKLNKATLFQRIQLADVSTDVLIVDISHGCIEARERERDVAVSTGEDNGVTLPFLVVVVHAEGLEVVGQSGEARGCGRQRAGRGTGVGRRRRREEYRRCLLR